MTGADALRVVASASVAEMALTRRDPLASVLLAQAARGADGVEGGAALAAAARLTRAIDPGESDATAFAARKAAQALCRVAIQEAQASLLASVT